MKAFELNTDLFNDGLTTGSFLTKVEYDEKRKRILATFKDFENGKIIYESIVTLHNNQYNNHRVEVQKLESLSKLIEIHDKTLYDKIEKLQIDAEYYQFEYRLKRFISFVQMGGAISFGYALANMDNVTDPLLILLISSSLVILCGLRNRKLFIENKENYEKNCEEIYDSIESNTNKYVRVKK